jgi:hypothetical protein
MDEKIRFALLKVFLPFGDELNAGHDQKSPSEAGAKFHMRDI